MRKIRMPWRPCAACSPQRQNDFITAVDEKNIILVREVKPGETYEDLEKTANTILDMLNTEAMSKVRIAFGTIVGEIKDVFPFLQGSKDGSRCRKDLLQQQERCSVLQPRYWPSDLSASASTLPDVYQRKFFDGKNPDEFDEETLTTINKFLLRTA